MRKRRVVWGVVALVLTAGLVVINMLFGNPISRRNAQREQLRYYETAYGEGFTVYDSRYSTEIQSYVFEIGPEDRAEMRFDTTLFSQGITDGYGGMLAARKLSEDIDVLLRVGYGHLAYEVSAREDPLIAYAGETPDYFEADPAVRVVRNHYLVEVLLPDGMVKESELPIIASGMASTIEARLPYETPNLQVNVRFSSDLPAWASDGSEDRGEVFILFSTLD